MCPPTRPPCQRVPAGIGVKGPGAKADSVRADQRSSRALAMSVSTPFIRRPIATSLLAVAVTLGGWLGYFALPISSLPQVDFPTIQVTTQLPGASPDTM